MNVKNLDYIRGLKSADFPDLGAKLYEALKSIGDQASNTQSQTNANPSGQPTAPPAINGLKVTGQNGHFNLAITDNNPIYRGIQYYAEHDTSPNFTNPQVIHLGDARNHNVFLGNQTLYWRAYSSYSSSPPSAPAYHGSGAAPTPVAGGGTIGGPAFQASQGSGTGSPGQGLAGPGIAPFRSKTGTPPVR
jgi:hypothetical protein